MEEKKDEEGGSKLRVRYDSKFWGNFTDYLKKEKAKTQITDFNFCNKSDPDIRDIEEQSDSDNSEIKSSPDHHCDFQSSHNGSRHRKSMSTHRGS